MHEACSIYQLNKISELIAITFALFTGVDPSELDIQQAVCGDDERVYW